MADVSDKQIDSLLALMEKMKKMNGGVLDEKDADLSQLERRATCAFIDFGCWLG